MVYKKTLTLKKTKSFKKYIGKPAIIYIVSKVLVKYKRTGSDLKYILIQSFKMNSITATSFNSLNIDSVDMFT